MERLTGLYVMVSFTIHRGVEKREAVPLLVDIGPGVEQLTQLLQVVLLQCQSSRCHIQALAASRLQGPLKGPPRTRPKTDRGPAGILAVTDSDAFSKVGNLDTVAARRSAAAVTACVPLDSREYRAAVHRFTSPLRASPASKISVRSFFGASVCAASPLAAPHVLGRVQGRCCGPVRSTVPEPSATPVPEMFQRDGGQFVPSGVSLEIGKEAFVVAGVHLMNSFDDLTSLDLRSLAEVLASHAPAQAELVPGQWLGIVELLTMHLTEGFDDLPTELWSTCSEACGYALETAVASGAIDYRESVIRRLNLALPLLQKAPPNAEFDVLNPDHLVDLLLQELPISAEEARTLLVDWRSLDTSQIRLLRAAKNLVSPGLAIFRLTSGKGFDPRLRAWEEVLPSLP